MLPLDAGHPRIPNRYKDVVKSRDENVSLRVEAALAQHFDVARAAVTGLPQARWGKAVTAGVVLCQGCSAARRI